MDNKLSKSFILTVIRNLIFIIFISTALSVPVSLRIVNHTEIGFAPAYFCMAFAKSLFVSVILALICGKHKAVKLTTVLICALLSGIYICILYLFNSRITPKVLTLFFQTDSQEIKDFFSAYISLGVCLKLAVATLAFAFIYIALDRIWQRLTAGLNYSLKRVGLYSGISMVIVLCSASLNFFPDYSRAITDASSKIDNIKMYISDVSMPYQEAYRSWKVLSSLEDVMPPLINGINALNITDCRHTAPHIIWVLGESAIKSHFDLYGYSHPTNPMLSEELQSGNLFLFSDVVSKYRDTASSMLSLFPSSDLNETLGTDTVMLLPAVMKKAGYWTEFYDNHTTRSPKLNILKEEFFLDPSPIHENCFDLRNPDTYDYDHKLIDYWRQNTKSDAKPYTFTIFHLQGEHFDPIARYPHNEENTYFTADSIRRKGQNITKEMREEIAYYDNAMRYNDRLLNTIISHYRDREAVLVYTPDHGECIYDNASLNAFRSLKEENDLDLIKSFHEVPFFIWCSDLFMEKHPDVIKMLADASGTPFLVQDLPQIIYEIAGAKGSFADSTHCPIRKEFIPKKRIIYNGDHPFHYDDRRAELDTITMQSAYN